MGRLAGFSYRKVIAVLHQFKFMKHRDKKHEKWMNWETGKKVMVPRTHKGDFPEGTLRAILEQAGISPEEFLAMAKGKSKHKPKPQ